MKGQIVYYCLSRKWYKRCVITHKTWSHK